MMLSLATANAQTFQWQSSQEARPRECDFHGCYFDDLKKWRALQNDLHKDLQNELQRRAEEARKKLEANRKNSN
jgi:hypothetical protein